MDLWLTSAAKARPGATALVADGRSLSYSELEHGAESAARRLAALGVGEGDRVAATLPAGIEHSEEHMSQVGELTPDPR